MIVNVVAIDSASGLVMPSIPHAQLVYVAPAVRRPYLPGAFVRDPGDVPVPLAITVRRASDPWVPVVVLDQGKDFQWQDELNEAGGGSFVLANDDPDLAYIQPGDRVLFEVEGYAAFTVLPRELESVAVAEGEEAGQLTTVSGPGTLAVLEDALVYPSRGVGVWPIEEDRVFSWPSPDYNDEWWGTAVEMAKWSDATYWTTTSAAGSPPAPSDWPDPDARWIWGQGWSWRWAPDGSCYVRRQFDVPEGYRRIDVYVALDWTGDIFIDGQNIGSNTWEIQDTNFFQQEVDITPGTHNIAISCLNDVDPEGDQVQNPGGILCAIYLVGNGGRQDLLLHSDASWKMLAYPASPPGMTPGEAMWHCIREAKDRALLLDLDVTFDNTVDSAGVPWPVVGDIATKVGTDLLTFFRELSETYIDFAMSPAGNVLWAWAAGTRGIERAVALHTPTDPTDPTTGNLGQLRHTRVFGATQRALVRWAGGWSQVGSPVPTGREVLLGLGALQVEDEMLRVSQAQLADFADPRTEIAADVVPMGLADLPVVAFGVGDFITVPDFDGTPTVERVISIGGTLDENGRLSWAVDLKDRLLDERERTEQALKKMINGTLRGASKVATPVGDIARRQLPLSDGGGDD
jgi:hypothetical protein